MSEQRPPAPKAIPHPNIETQYYWDKVQEDQLWLQFCKDCSKFYFYPRFFCPTCLGKNVEWRQASGKGKLYTYMINHRPAPGFDAEAPYAIAVVELDEGVRMMSNIHGIENTPENLVIDMPLKVTFEEINPGSGIKVPYFVPA